MDRGKGADLNFQEIETCIVTNSVQHSISKPFHTQFHILPFLSTFHQGQRQNTALPNRGGVYFPL